MFRIYKITFIFFVDSESKEEKSIRNKILNKMAGNILVKNDQWYQYEKPIWVAKSPDFIAEAVRSNFREITNIAWMKTPFFSRLFNDLKTNCIKSVNLDISKYIGFKNGVLNWQTMEFETEEPEANDLFKLYYFRDFLPYDFQTLDISEIHKQEDLEILVQQNMPAIYNWFSETLENFEFSAIILCFAAAIIKQYKLDRFLYFFGPSNTGKSTAIRFFDKLFISDAVITKQLSDLSSSFGLAEIVETNVRLLVVRDAEGSISGKTVAVLKNLVSNCEPISVSRKFLTSVNFVFSGGIIIASNFSNIFQKTAKGILEERIIPIEFSNVISPENQKELDIFFPESEKSCPFGC
uniref:SF3 helicase domain-containing protein n=1 Tax=Rhipiliopsis peltata TaxID=2320810 RepID=A0A386B185_9CHLO|nr:hypothetical protein [Rhipiliopsis peltata]AYC65461.1 hypothetical protein [Rhipiliopsis peltata]